MTRILQRDEILAIAREVDTIAAMEQAFVAYSAGQTVIPPIGHLVFDEPRGDTCIKYGYEKGAETFVVKIASGFYDNPARGLPVSTGIMVVFCQQTGTPQAVLLDNGYLTDLRTGAAGAVAARHVGPAEVEHIGILGSGTQARFQLRALADVTDCREVSVWGRDQERCEAFADEMKEHGFRVRVTSLDALCEAANLIVTTTPSHEPLLAADQVRPGTHITAVGSDGPGKQELASDLLGRADHVVADSLSQCSEVGEVRHALAAGAIEREAIVELGTCIEARPWQRRPQDITVADLTGVAIQDVAIATAVLRGATEKA